VARSRHKHQKTRPLVRKIAPIAAPAALVAGVGAATIAWPTGDITLEPNSVTSALTPLERPESLSRGSDRTPAATSTATPGPTASPTQAPVAAPSAAPTEAPAPAPTEDPAAADVVEPEPEPTPEPTAVGTLFATAGLNVRTGPSTDNEVVTVLERGTEVEITGATEGDFAQVLIDGKAHWASAKYLSEEEPVEEEEGISQEACPDGSGVESGLTSDAIRVHRAVCAQFPEIDSYGGLRSGDGGEHGSGRALDIMVTGSLGDSIAAWLRDHYQELGISELIWEQRIWTVERSSEGWRWMEDRGGATANHYDHVHVSVYGNEGTV
jgi:hypothetical protein